MSKIEISYTNMDFIAVSYGKTRRTFSVRVRSYQAAYSFAVAEAARWAKLYRAEVVNLAPEPTVFGDASKSGA